jgi:N-acetylglucosamine-6-phosphate deacetylase
MTRHLLASSALCRPGAGAPEPGWLAVEDEVIVEVGAGAPPPGAADVGAAALAPAFVDLQLNGVDDVDLATADAAGWQRVGEQLARHGVAAYLATFASAPLEAYDGALARLEAAQRVTGPRSAAALGAHLEGPFLGGAPGVHPVERLRAADLAWLESTLGAHPDVVRMVTLAPEADRGLEGVRWLARHGVLVALGHSQASLDEARAAAAAGARVVTHVFNGMGPLHHRAPGLVGAALDDDRLTPTLIADLVHVDATVVRIVLAAKRDVAVVSDAVAVRDDREPSGGAARLPDGRLAGATQLLDGALENLVRIGVPLERAVAVTSTVPAALLGRRDRGRLVAGARADVVALDRSTGALRAVWIGGEPVR